MVKKFDDIFSTEYRSVTDRQTDRQKDRQTDSPRYAYASRRENGCECFRAVFSQPNQIPEMRRCKQILQKVFRLFPAQASYKKMGSQTENQSRSMSEHL